MSNYASSSYSTPRMQTRGTKRKSNRTFPVKPTYITKKQKGFVRVSGFYGRFSGINDELKFHDVSHGAFTPLVTGTVTNAGSIVNIPQGNGESDRIGRKCTIKSVHARGQITIPPTEVADECDDIVRIILYQDRQCNGASTNTTSILKSSNWRSYINLSNKDRFRILATQVIAINCHAGRGNATGGVIDFGSYTIPWTMNKKVNINMEISNDDGSLSGIRSNNINFLFISSAGKAEVDFDTRVRFSDGG